MGIFKAALGAVGGALADQWLETIEPNQIDNATLASYGVPIRRDGRSSNKKGTEDIISNGSIIHVPLNTYMLLVEGGKIVSATDEEGYYQVDQSRAPSLFFQAATGVQASGYGNTGTNSIQRPGGLVNTLTDSWERFKFGGTTPLKQRVIYINKQEIPDIRFGTKNPVPYTDRVLVPGRPVPCKVTSFGTYSIKVLDPLLFYSEVCSKTSKTNFLASDMAEQYINEFLMAYTTALATLSTQGVMVSDIPIKTAELGSYMADVLDKEWLAKRGFFIHSVGIAGISFDEKTDELLQKYANDSILFDPNARAARMTAGMASGLEAAGSNAGGSMVGFAGMAMGMNAAGGMGVMPGQQMANQQGYSAPQGNTWTCACGNVLPETAGFCSKCGKGKTGKVEAGGWTCKCGAVSEGIFCPSCGSKKPEKQIWTCSCGRQSSDAFCASCGNRKPEQHVCKGCGYAPENQQQLPKFCPKCGTAF